MTQQEVADKLNVSNKTVSKWERDEGCPEIMMLPAIAELYSVTVDEILRGERMAKISQQEYDDSKSKERIKYLIEKATAKFTNHSIIAIVLGVVALILSYTVSDIIYNHNFLWVGYVIILLLLAASFAIVLVAVNSVVSSLYNEDIVERQSLESAMKNCIKFVAVITFLAVVTLFGLLINIVLDGAYSSVVVLPAGAVVGIIVSYVVCAFLYKKFNIKENEMSCEQKKCRKKHFKITAVIITVVILASLLSPFISVGIENWLSDNEYCFKNGVGYQYTTTEEAENEYYKLKGFVVDKEKLYTVTNEEYLEDSNKYILYLEALTYDFEKTKDGYNLIFCGAENDAEEELEFGTYEEMEQFKKKSVYSCEELDINMLQKSVSFDDETLTVKYKFNSDTFSRALDILPVFIMIGSFVCIAVFAVSAAIYHIKKKRIAAEIN